MDLKCWTCDQPIQDGDEVESYGEEIRHVECPEPTWAEERPLEMPGYGALFVMAARGERSPWED
jgi:hypothetical protein